MPNKTSHNPFQPRPRLLKAQRKFCQHSPLVHRRHDDSHKRKLNKQVKRQLQARIKDLGDKFPPSLTRDKAWKQIDLPVMRVGFSFTREKAYVPVEVWQKICASEHLTNKDLKNISLVSKEALSAASLALFGTIDLQSPSIVKVARHKVLSQIPRIAHVTILDSDYALNMHFPTSTWLPCRNIAAGDFANFFNLREIVLRYPKQGRSKKGAKPDGRGCNFWCDVLSKATMPNLKGVRIYGALAGGHFLHTYVPSDSFLRTLTSLDLRSLDVLSPSPFKIIQLLETMPNLKNLKIRNIRPTGLDPETSVKWPTVDLHYGAKMQFKLEHLVLENVRMEEADVLKLLSDTLQTVAVIGVQLSGQWKNVFPRIKALARRSLRDIRIRHVGYDIAEFPDDLSFLRDGACIVFTWAMCTWKLEDCAALGDVVREADRQELHGNKMSLACEDDLYRHFDLNTPPLARRQVHGMIQDGAFPWADGFSENVIYLARATQWEWSVKRQVWFQPEPYGLDGLEDPAKGVSSGDVWPWTPISKESAEKLQMKRY